MTKIQPLSKNRFNLLRKLKQKKYREFNNLFLCEGYRIFQEAVKSPHAHIAEIILTESFLSKQPSAEVLKIADQNHIPVSMANEKEVRLISEEVTPPGILCSIKSSLKSAESLKIETDKYIVYLESISDPGNLGSIIRTAMWFGLKTVILSPDCVDPYNAKVVRSSAGAIFHCSLYRNIESGFLFNTFKGKNYSFVATVPEGGISLQEFNPVENLILFFGPEAHGLSSHVIKNCQIHLSVEKYGDVESLNVSVAAAIILHSLTSK